MLEGLAIGLITLTVALFLIAPLFERAEVSAAAGRSAERVDLAIQQASVYTTLEELSLDHATGKLSDSDYAELKERYSAEAVEILERLDAARRRDRADQATKA